MVDKLTLKYLAKRKGVDLAAVIGRTLQTVSNKANGRTEFTVAEIASIMQALELSPEQVVDIFISPKTGI